MTEITQEDVDRCLAIMTDLESDKIYNFLRINRYKWLLHLQDNLLAIRRSHMNPAAISLPQLGGSQPLQPNPDHVQQLIPANEYEELGHGELNGPGIILYVRGPSISSWPPSLAYIRARAIMAGIPRSRLNLINKFDAIRCLDEKNNMLRLWGDQVAELLDRESRIYHRYRDYIQPTQIPIINLSKPDDSIATGRLLPKHLQLPRNAEKTRVEQLRHKETECQAVSSRDEPDDDEDIEDYPDWEDKLNDASAYIRQSHGI